MLENLQVKDWWWFFDGLIKLQRKTVTYLLHLLPVIVEHDIGSLVERTMRASLRYLLAARSTRGLSEGECPLWAEVEGGCDAEEGDQTLKHSLGPRGLAGGEGEGEAAKGLIAEVPPEEATEVGEQGWGGGGIVTGSVSFRLVILALMRVCGVGLGGSSGKCLAEASSSHMCIEALSSSHRCVFSAESSWSRLLKFSEDQSGERSSDSCVCEDSLYPVSLGRASVLVKPRRQREASRVQSSRLVQLPLVGAVWSVP